MACPDDPVNLRRRQSAWCAYIGVKYFDSPGNELAPFVTGRNVFRTVRVLAWYNALGWVSKIERE